MLWEIVFYTLFAPILSILLCTCIWAGISLRQSRQSLELLGIGEMYFNNSAHFLTDGSAFCYDVPQEDVVVDGEVVFTNYLLGVSPVCSYDSDNPSATTYKILESFSGSGISTMLSVLFLLACTVFYVSHSDSTTFIVDTIASNGRKNYHWSRRMFWSGSLAALSTSLVSSTTADAATAPSSFALLCSFPVLVLVCFLMQSISLMCQAADALKESTNDDTEYNSPKQPEFNMPVYGGVLNVIEYVVSLGTVNTARVELGTHQPTSAQATEFATGLFVPFVSLHKILHATYPQNPRTNALVVKGYALCFLTWVALALTSMSRPGLRAVALTLFGLTGIFLAMIRNGFRAHYNIRSNALADVVCGMLLWPQALAQMRLYSHDEYSDKNNMEAKTKTPSRKGAEKASVSDEASGDWEEA